MGTRFNIAVTATDAATARIRAIKSALGNIVRPIGEVGQSIKALGKETGVDKIGGGISVMAKNASEAVKSIGALTPALAGVTAAGTLGAMAAYTKQLVYSGSSTYRLSQTTGIAADRLQIMEGAAKLAGLSAGDLDSSVAQLGQTMNQAKWGQNNTALLTMNKLGVRLKYTKTGAVDTESALGDLADAMGPGGYLDKIGASVQTKGQVADIMGVGALLPVLLRGRKALGDYEKQAAAARPPIDAAAMDKSREAIDKMSLSFEGLANTMAAKTLPWLNRFSDWVVQHNKNVVANIHKDGLGGALGASGEKYLKDAGNGIFAGMGGAAKDLGEFFNLGKVIAAKEGGYDDVNLGKKHNYKSAKIDLVDSSVASVMRAQDRGDFNAAGKYQTTRKTLADAVKALRIDPEKTKFDAATQERIFRDYLLKVKRPEIYAYTHGKSDDLHAALKAGAKEWASIADPDTGKSYYDGIGNNKAGTTAEQFGAALKASRAQFLANRTPAPAPPPGPRPRPDAQAPVVIVPAPDAPISSAAPSPDGQPGPDGAPGQPAPPTPLSSAQDGKIWAPPPPQPQRVDGTITLKLSGLPAGVKAEAQDNTGPLKMVLKTESSMPDFSL